MPATYTDRLDGLTTSVAIKAPCRVATTAAITLSGLQTIDGMTLETDDRVLVKDQADASENGIYDAQSSTWTRSLDFDGSRDVVGGTFLKVNHGTSNANSYWDVSGNGPLIPGVDDITITPTSGNITLQADLLLSAGAALVGRIASGTGATATTVQTKLREIASNGDRGAANDGTTNDQAADQLAITNSISGTKAGKLHIGGVSKLSSTVNIDRAVDGTSGELIVDGEGVGGGFAVSSAITMFGSSVAVTTAPVTEMTRFKDLRLYSSSAALNAYAISSAFLRTKFDQCNFDKLKLVTSAIYLQQLELNGVYAKYWSGTFCTANNGGGTARGLAFRVRGSAFEAGGTGFALNGIVGGGISDILYEGNTGPVLTISDHAGMLLSNGYHEGYTTFQYQLGDQSTSSGEGHGSAIIANYLQSGTTGVYAFKLGKTWGAGIGNYCNDDLYDTTYARLGSFLSVGDYAVARKFSGDGFHEVTADGVTLMGVPGGTHAQTNYTAHAGGGQASATQLLHPTNYVGTVATAGDSVALPATDDCAYEYGKLVWVVNDGASVLDVYYAQSDVANFGGGGGRTTPFIVPVGQARGFLVVGQGKIRMITPPQMGAVTAPVGGGTVDTQARTAIASIITALQGAGLMA